MMKNDAEAQPGDRAAATDVEPAPATDQDPSVESKERDLDELRRFRVRTVPPDMRRQWMLAETPVVSTLELQGTLPPHKRPSSAPPEPGATPPQPLFGGPRVSSTAATRRLPTVPPRSERAAGVAIILAGLVAAAVIFALVWNGIGSRKGSATPQTRVSELAEPRAPVLSPAVHHAVSGQRDPAPVVAPSEPPLQTTPAVSAAGLLSNRTPVAKTHQLRTEEDHKLPPSMPAASGKIPPAQKPRPDSDIKSPLFGE